MEDARFGHLKKDPRFKKLGKGNRKVKIDDRFKHMFTDPKFSSVDFLDSRGRKEKQVTKEKLEKFYELGSSEDESKDGTVEDNKEQQVEPDVGSVATADSNDESELEEESDDDSGEAVQTAPDDELNPDDNEKEVLSDGLNESDSSDGETDSEGEVVEDVPDAWDEVTNCTETTSESTHRVSICNLNWDRMNANDIFVLCNSTLKDSQGSIEKVEVYPSQFGKEQMAKEREKGPAIKAKERVEEEEGEDGSKEFNSDALRKYQIERLKYYYSIVTCASTAVADALYKELDGVEYQLSSSMLDLRFVPDDMVFDEDSPSSMCTSMPDMTTYKPPTFITTALQNSSVKLTWDETDQSRLELTTRKFNSNDLENVDFSAYLASSESESENSETEGPSLERYKALLSGLQEEDKDDVDQEMEITWTDGLEHNDEVVEEAEKNEERQGKATFYQPDEKDDFFATDTVIDKPKRKSKKKKGKGKEEMTKEQSELALLMESEADEKKHFNMKKILKSKKDDDFTVDIEDNRFSAFKSSHHFAIDPSAPEYKETGQTKKMRAAQAAAMSENSSVAVSQGGGDSVIDKIRNRTSEFQSKKDNSKLFKTKNKGYISSNKTLKDQEIISKDPVLVEKSKKSKKKRKLEIISNDPIPVEKSKKPKRERKVETVDNPAHNPAKLKKKKKHKVADGS